MRPRILIAVGLAALAGLVPGCGGDGEPAGHGSPSGAALHAPYTVEGHAMYIDCRGHGAPAVILDAGLGVDASSTWMRVQPMVSGLTRVCWYDRAGMGRSDPRPAPRTAARMVAEERGLLAAAGVRGPYVLVGASFGGLVAQLFAATFPRDVGGIVLVDAIHPDLDRRIARVLGPTGEAARENALASNGEGVSYADLLASDDEVRTAGSLPAVRVVALRHGVSFDPGGRPDPRVERLWTELQRDLAARSPLGRYVRVPGSHHRIAEDHPEAVADAIREVVLSARDPAG